MAYTTRGHAIAALGLGIVELLLGLIIVICSFVLYGKLENAKYTPYWAGFCYVVPGILGCIVGCTKSYGVMVAYMVLNIIAFILMGVASIILAIFLSVYATVFTEFRTHCDSSIFDSSTCSCTYNGQTINFTVSCNTLDTVLALFWAIIVVCGLSAIVTLASSILGCVSVCCTPAQQPGNLVIQEQVPQPTYPGYVAAPPAYYPQTQMQQPVKGGVV